MKFTQVTFWYDQPIGVLCVKMVQMKIKQGYRIRLMLTDLHHECLPFWAKYTFYGVWGLIRCMRSMSMSFVLKYYRETHWTLTPVDSSDGDCWLVLHHWDEDEGQKPLFAASSATVGRRVFSCALLRCYKWIRSTTLCGVVTRHGGCTRFHIFFSLFFFFLIPHS